MWISCNLRTDRHSVAESSFQRFQAEALNTRIGRLGERRVRISVRSHDPAANERTQIHNAHFVIKAIVLSLNVGSLGLFYWENDPWVHPILTVADDLDGTNSRDAALVVTNAAATFGELVEFSDRDEYNTMLLFGVFARGSAGVLEDEYCRGLLLLRMNFCEINFRRDAFMCFYRTLEHFVTSRILGVPKLRNELRELQSCLSGLGFSQAIVDEMRELYAIRSSQAAHSQSTPRDITLDEVMKMKIFVDAVIHKPLLAEANALMAKQVASRADA